MVAKDESRCRRTAASCPTFTTTAAEDADSSSHGSSSHASSGQDMSGMKGMSGMDMSKSSASDDTARWLGGIGIGLGVIAVFIALFRRDSGPVTGARGRTKPGTSGTSGSSESD